MQEELNRNTRIVHLKELSMNSRERILMAINQMETDRIPIDLIATPDSGISAIAHGNPGNRDSL